MPDPLVLIGGGGHCRSCIFVLESSGYRIAGIIDAEVSEVLGYPVLGGDDQVPNFRDQNFFLVTVGQVANAAIRRTIYSRVKQSGGRFATVVASSALVSEHAAIGEGSIIMHQAIVNSNAKIGVNCIINNKALVEHDSFVGDHSHVSTAAVINGHCVVGSGVFVGSSAVLSHGIRVADDVVIGAGSVVVRNIDEPGVYAGNPAKRIK